MKEKKVFLVAGLAYGDEGKGSMTDYLVRREKARAVVRYNGGAQAAHRVVLNDGREHVFAQFGSGTLVPGVKTHLSRFMLVEPFGLMREYEHLAELGFGNALERLTIDEMAPVITPYHIATNRLLEYSRGDSRHGSCGLGIGETMEDVRSGEDILRAGDLLSPSVTKLKLGWLRERKLAKLHGILHALHDNDPVVMFNRSVLEDPAALDGYASRYKLFAGKVRIVDIRCLQELLEKGTVVFEGAQGVLLDPQYGVQPHVTKTDITFNNAMTLLNEIHYGEEVKKVGVVRAYFTRHGAGPFPTEDAGLTELLPDTANKDHKWQGKFRVGHFNAADVKYALGALDGVDELAVTCLDRLYGVPELKVCVSYREPGVPSYKRHGAVRTHQQALAYAGHLADLADHTNRLVYSFGPTAEDKFPHYETLTTH